MWNISTDIAELHLWIDVIIQIQPESFIYTNEFLMACSFFQKALQCKVSQWTPAPRFEGFITRSFLTAVGLWSQQDIFCRLAIKHLNFKIILFPKYQSSLEKNEGEICTHKPLKIWEDIKKSTIYLCSGSRPKGRHNSGLRCTPVCCWYTCYCGKRKYLPHRELMRGKNG